MMNVTFELVALMFHAHEILDSNLEPKTGYCEYSFHDLPLSAHKCGYNDKGIFERHQILHLFIFKFKNMYNTNNLLCTQYPSHQSNGNIVMESITGHVICKKQLINPQIIMTNGVR
jgi:hypothetical protein